MGIFDNIQKNDKNEFIVDSWIEWKHISGGFLHCPICLSLDKCWFNSLKMPVNPLHEKCHCTTFQIEKPIPYVNAKADCDIKKFTDYIFGDKYAWNGKRQMFEILGFSKNDSKYLKEEFEKQAVKKYTESKYELHKLNTYGQRINIDIEIYKNGRNVKFTSGWMVNPKGKITNNTPLGD